MTQAIPQFQERFSTAGSDGRLAGGERNAAVTVALDRSRLMRLMRRRANTICLLVPDSAERLRWQRRLAAAGIQQHVIDPHERNAPIGTSSVLWVTSAENCARDSDLISLWRGKNSHVDFRVCLHGPFHVEAAERLHVDLAEQGVTAADLRRQLKRIGVIEIPYTPIKAKTLGARYAAAGLVAGITSAVFGGYELSFTSDTWSIVLSLSLLAGVFGLVRETYFPRSYHSLASQALAR